MESCSPRASPKSSPTLPAQKEEHDQGRERKESEWVIGSFDPVQISALTNKLKETRLSDSDEYCSDDDILLWESDSTLVRVVEPGEAAFEEEEAIFLGDEQEKETQNMSPRTKARRSSSSILPNDDEMSDGDLRPKCPRINDCGETDPDHFLKFRHTAIEKRVILSGKPRAKTNRRNRSRTLQFTYYKVDAGEVQELQIYNYENADWQRKSQLRDISREVTWDFKMPARVDFQLENVTRKGSVLFFSGLLRNGNTTPKSISAMYGDADGPFSVGSESLQPKPPYGGASHRFPIVSFILAPHTAVRFRRCLLYTSDAADE
eukprot:TRINITY_DN7984_c0_g1_i2.p1 TRINITY_DN7984_c0_g1~~TRINITY_DN7984_c0_g1_i2.p1  ORF type:complete len:352 (+),score=56.16 TRINITY_DN7984_c0_g1_i2:101-1057(+)